MAENARRFRKSNINLPQVETHKGGGKGLLHSLANHSCIIITDSFPGFFLPRMVAAAAQKIPVRLIQVDSNGLLPLRAAGRTFPTAYSFRRLLQKTLPIHLSNLPKADPFRKLDLLPLLRGLPAKITERWPIASNQVLAADPRFLAQLPIDQGVQPGFARGGTAEAEARWREFLNHRRVHYDEKRNQPELEGTSGLSPYLHFGHISVHQLYSELMKKEDWSIEKLTRKTAGSRKGW